MFILIVVITVSGGTMSYVKVTPDAVACVSEADTVRQGMNSVPGEWVLRTRCVPVGPTQEV